jgi:hypothetical protein
MVKMMSNYEANKIKLVISRCCCHTITTAVILFSFFLGLSMVGDISGAAGSISTTPEMGGQESGEEEQPTPESCGSLTDGINNRTTTGIDGLNNSATSLLYENPDYGIQILCPENWVYLEEENPFTGDFQVTFVSLDPEVAPIVGVFISELPSGDLDLQLFADLNIQDLTSTGYEIISSSLNATLSGMPAWEVVYVDTNRTMFLQDWTIQGERAYAVMYISHESRFNQFLPIARDMISSFTITNEVRGTTIAPGANTSNTTTQFQTPLELPSSPTTTSTTAAATTTTDVNNQGISLEAAKEQYLTVWNQTDFGIPFNTFIEPDSVAGYGIYEEHADNNIFTPGETIQLYLEPVAFGHQQIQDDNGNTLYIMNFTADIILSDVNGNELRTFEGIPVGSIVSYRQNTDMHLILTVTQSQPFPVGDYIVTYVVHDQVTGQSFQIDKRITIDDVDASTGGLPLQDNNENNSMQQQLLPQEQLEEE